MKLLDSLLLADSKCAKFFHPDAGFHAWPRPKMFVKFVFTLV